MKVLVWVSQVLAAVDSACLLLQLSVNSCRGRYISSFMCSAPVRVEKISQNVFNTALA